MRYWNNKQKPKNTSYLGQKNVCKIPYLSGLVYTREAQIAWFLYDLVDDYLTSEVQLTMMTALPSSLENSFCNVWGTHAPLMSAEVK